MAIALPLIVLAVVMLAMLGTKLAVVFGLFVGWATFSFPYGLIGMVAIGVTVAILLIERERT